MSKPGIQSNPEPNHTRRVEPKVWWATIGAYLAGVVGLAVVDVFTANDYALLLNVLPDGVEWVIMPLVPAIVAFVSGFAARHQWRSSEVASPPAGERRV